MWPQTPCGFVVGSLLLEVEPNAVFKGALEDSEVQCMEVFFYLLSDAQRFFEDTRMPWFVVPLRRNRTKILSSGDQNFINLNYWGILVRRNKF